MRFGDPFPQLPGQLGVGERFHPAAVERLFLRFI
jgi:hypothetical protein